MRRPGRWPGLTVRESEVADLIVLGRERAQIQVLFKASSKTYDTHRRNILRKLGLRNNVELCLHAVRNGLLRVEVVTDGPSPETLQRYRDLADGKRPQEDWGSSNMQPCPS